jgi:uncharacterized protein (TIGR04255 family)
MQRMASGRHYANAPITEAIIDLRVEPRAGISAETFAAAREGEDAAYPSREEMYEAAGTMEFRKGAATASAHQRQTGYRFTSADGKNIFQARSDGFTLSRLAPYESWEPFRDEARRLWSGYRKRFGPAQITRLAVRYINRIDMPGNRVDLKRYLRTAPEVSPDLPQDVEGLFLQIRIPQTDIQSHALVNEAIVPPVREGVLSVVLDIDLFRANNVPGDEEGIWQFFDVLHTRKNDIFEACITDDTRRLIQ